MGLRATLRAAAAAAGLGAATAAAAALVSACTLLRPLDGLTCEPGAGNASCLYGDACEADADCATASCAASTCQCPAGMVTIQSTFCIDQTEVSNAAYRRFLETGPDVAAQEPFCAFNDSFAFDETVDEPGDMVPPDCLTRRRDDDYPATCVDWCDAHAYCKSLGKRLCGKIHGGALPYGGDTDGAQGEWYEACSKGGTRAYSTGELDLQCNGDGQEPVAVNAGAACEGGYHGLLYMSGNVREWEDSCSGDVGPEDDCTTRGGSFDSGDSPEQLQCSAREGSKRADTYHGIGFRCCSG
ncbi:formylglycine-generating enzyme family protein [Sorangium sp. So ce131]|uniref:formylglycine-generating enzyme family protein n=1 Tax=Sorangium sp. So ce131 TaxID=3133282 RepID=UPI003F64182F